MAKNLKYNGESIKRIVDSHAAMALDRKLGSQFRDAAGQPQTGLGMFLQQQLTFIIPQILKQEFPAMPALQIFQADNSGTWDKQILTRLRTLEGRHQPTHTSTTKDGKITIGTNYNQMLVVDYEGSSDYDYKSLNKAKQLGEDIDGAIVEAHNNSYNTIVDEVSFLGINSGDSVSNQYTMGIANTTLIPDENTLSATYDWTDPTTTGNEIVEDILKIRNAIYGIGGGNSLWMPNVMVCSPEIFAIISGKNFSVTGFTTSETVMSYCKKQYGITFYASNHVKGLAADSKDRIVVLNNDPRAVILHLPRPLEFFPVDVFATKFQLTSAFSVAGINLRQPTTAGWLDMI